MMAARSCTAATMPESEHTISVLVEDERRLERADKRSAVVAAPAARHANKRESGGRWLKSSIAAPHGTVRQ